MYRPDHALRWLSCGARGCFSVTRGACCNDADNSAIMLRRVQRRGFSGFHYPPSRMPNEQQTTTQDAAGRTRTAIYATTCRCDHKANDQRNHKYDQDHCPKRNRCAHRAPLCNQPQDSPHNVIRKG